LKSDFEKQVVLDPDLIPAHVAIIMDGNGRWARKKLMNRVKGHEQGTKTVRTIVEASKQAGIKHLTLYAFSTENWERPKTEVKALMMLLKRFVVSEREELAAKNIRLNIIGQKDRLPPDVQKEINTTMGLTASNTGMLLNLALSYGSRQEITDAVREIAVKIREGSISPDEITQELVSDHLYTRSIPDPDLIIRTSGEYRLSNFLMWQAAYAEIYISSTLWPDFSAEEYYEILNDFQKRDRRFGRVVECSTSKDG
jgi:undecaprenyl diphosphate synthase